MNKYLLRIGFWASLMACSDHLMAQTAQDSAEAAQKSAKEAALAAAEAAASAETSKTEANSIIEIIDKKTNGFFDDWSVGIVLQKPNIKNINDASVVDGVVRVNSTSSTETTLMLAYHFFTPGKSGKRCGDTQGNYLKALHAFQPAEEVCGWWMDIQWICRLVLLR